MTANASLFGRLCEVCLIRGPQETKIITERLNRGMATQKDIEDLLRIVRVFPFVFVSIVVGAFILGGWVMSIQMTVSRATDDIKDHSSQLKEINTLFYKIDKKLPDIK